MLHLFILLAMTLLPTFKSTVRVCCKSRCTKVASYVEIIDFLLLQGEVLRKMSFSLLCTASAAKFFTITRLLLQISCGLFHFVRVDAYEGMLKRN